MVVDDSFVCRKDALDMPRFVQRCDYVFYCKLVMSGEVQVQGINYMNNIDNFDGPIIILFEAQTCRSPIKRLSKYLVACDGMIVA